MLCLYTATVSVTSECIQYLCPDRYIIILVHKVLQVQMTPQSLGYNDWGMLLAWETSPVPGGERERRREIVICTITCIMCYTHLGYTHT